MVRCFGKLNRTVNRNALVVTLDAMFCVHFCRVILAGEQKKLEGELQQIEEKHRAKKCRFAESSEQFYEQLARV